MKLLMTVAVSMLCINAHSTQFVSYKDYIPGEETGSENVVFDQKSEKFSATEMMKDI